MQIDADEVASGLVVRLDTTMLRRLGGSLTNAVRTPEMDRAVVGEHDFLLLRADANSGLVTAVPLFPSAAVGNQPLDLTKKSGSDEVWRTSLSYFSHWQHWQIPVNAVIAASASESTIAATRRRYSVEDPTEIDAIRNWERRNRAKYRDA